MIDERSDEVKTQATPQNFLSLLGGAWISQAIIVAAELRIADRVSDKALSATELARQTGCNERAMQQFMRALCTIGVCRQNLAGEFELAELGEFLCSESSESLRDMALWWGMSHWDLWGNLRESIRTGESGRKLLFGEQGFDFLAENPSAARIFNGAMSQLSRLENDAILGAFDFSPYGRVMDIGGGHGEFLRALMDANQGVRTVLFDLVETVETARASEDSLPYLDRCRFIGGSFFDSVPTDMSLHILKNVLHDWDDRQATTILRNCARALPSDGVIIIIERIMPEKCAESPSHRELARSDLTMLLAHAGKERTMSEFRKIAGLAGLELGRVTATTTPLSLLELVRKQ